MSNRIQIDSVIDDDDEFCPLCIEEFDLSDKNFKPCPCGYQICQFCYNNIKTHSEEGRCPNCRRVYDESTIQYKVPDVDEFKADLALKHRKAAAAKKKEAEKREIEASSRKNLAGVRVVQKNLVYVIGLNPTIRDENQLLQTLRGPEYFGQYGDIEKIVVSKAKPGGNPNQGIGVYVTFSRKADAATCIAAVDGSANGDRVLRAQYGTTKYCSSFLRNEQCNNRNCTFLHETGEDTDSFSRQDLSSMNMRQGYTNGAAGPSQQHHPSQMRPSAQPLQSSQPMRRQGSKDDSISRSGTNDGSALPSSASWANKDAPVNRARRASLTGSRSSPSPKPSSAVIANKADESKKQAGSSQDATSRRSTPALTNAQPVSQSQSRSEQPPPRPENPLLDELVKAVNSPDFKFVFSAAGLSTEEAAFIENHPSFIDPYGGVKRRAMREKAEQERAKQEAETQQLLQSAAQSAAAEEETRESGSLQLGGEPDDVHPPARGDRGRESHGAIQPPSQQGTATNSVIGSPVSAASHQFQNLNVGGRSLTPLQQQQLMLLKSANGQQAGLMDPLQTGFGSAGFDHTSQGRQGLFQNQMPQLSGMQGHNRQSSRFSFASDSNAKNNANARLLSQQASLMQSGTPNPLAAPTPQHSLASHFYTSGVQGPPPGLKTAGTPPISGGGMFAQGHGFTANASLGLGANLGKQDANPELMRELLRGRGSAGGLQGHEAAKREFMFPFLQQHQTPPPLTPATTGLLSSFYGSQAGAYPEQGPQKQKKKGKKHRHANTSSGGGGVVDLADPSILQARMHQVGANTAAGQALYGSQGQVDEEFPPLDLSAKDRPAVDSFGFPFRPHLTDSRASSIRSGTPTLPPGLPLPHAHPAAAFELDPSSPVRSPSIPPGFAPVAPWAGTPAQKLQENVSGHATPEPRGTPDIFQGTDRIKNALEISLGSPKPKPAKTRGQSKAENLSSRDKKEDSAATPDTPQRESSAKAKPIKLHLSTFTASHPQDHSPSKSDTTSQVVPGATASVVGSRPNTPLTGISRASDSSGPRQTRVLRVVDTPKAETPPPASATQSISSAQAVKGRSRRLSVSSVSRPETPGEAGSDYDPYTSASVSRANSPPPSKIGSAPVRAITKSQAKKERRLKAKQAEAKEAVATPVVEEPVQAPIIGRKRKTKKTASNNEPSSTAETATRATSEASRSPEKPAEDRAEQKSDVGKKTKSKEKIVKDAQSVTSHEKEVVDSGERETLEEWRGNNTIEQMIKDSEAKGIPIKDLFLERTSPLPVLLAQLHQSGVLDLNTHPLFNPPNLGQRSDMKCSSDDYDTLKQPIELTEEHRKKLLRGEPVRLNGDSTLLKSRCLITPSGCILRHLSPEEEDRYLALERSLSLSADSMQEYPAFSITDPDITNRGGGLDALLATPERFNVVWVDEPSQDAISGSTEAGIGTDGANSAVSVAASAPPNVLSAMEADTTRSHNWAIANTAELVNATAASVRSFAAATAKHMLGVTGIAMGDIPDLEDVMGMSDDELRTFIERSQRELESSRKDVDSIDKKLMALIKRNKKLAQQAMAATVEAS
ncbi:CCR4-NOT core complex subunit Not4, putative [Paecilomyces variotii No. 5]|uniref:CCR4-NOT core complex subunit Not4, putative n=1 Tax=Byssochlamys spectabilis (strain No. 5 / NBRC 109023) TaxID=1356009 RepID=V5FSY7_BYSSN|nr:CCR4-NOT core complex subunit Not4, putative [Paecilomyces variotii No. 5]